MGKRSHEDKGEKSHKQKKNKKHKKERDSDLVRDGVDDDDEDSMDADSQLKGSKSYKEVGDELGMDCLSTSRGVGRGGAKI